MAYHKKKSTGNNGKKPFGNNSNSSSSYKSRNSSDGGRSNEENSRYGNDNYKNNYDSDSENSQTHRFNRDNGKNFNSRPATLKKVRPTAEENKAFAIKGNYRPGRKVDSENYLNSNGKHLVKDDKPERAPQRSNNRINSNTPKSFAGSDLLARYDDWFGSSTGRRLKDSIQSYSQNQFVRINLSKMEIEDALAFFKKNRVRFENTFLPNGFKIEKTFFNLSSSLPCLTGKIYFQDLASQVPVNCVDFDRLKFLDRKVRVLDACASPGSKTSQILDLLNFHGIEYELTAIELEESRVNRLVNNIQKMGFSGFKIVNESAVDFKTSDKFDVILLDVPCSGNLVGDANWLRKRNVKDIREKADLQKSIVKNISKFLEKKGELIYSTCSIEKEENEDNVKWISKNCGLKNVKIELETGFDVRCLDGVLGLRFLPHVSKTQGFFVAKFVNK